MADPDNLDSGIEAYIVRNDGDLIRADEWNDIQRSARQDIRFHRHTGDAENPDDGVPIGSAGIESGAVTGEKIAAGAITAAKLELGAVTSEKVAAGAITSEKISGGSDSIVCNFPVADDITIREKEKILTSEIENADRLPSLATDQSDHLHVVWQGQTKENNRTIWYARLDGKGEVLSDPVSKLDSASGLNQEPSIAADSDGNLQIVWTGRDPSNNKTAIWYAKLAPNGNELIGPKLLVPSNPDTSSSGSPNGNQDAFLTTGKDGNLHIVWAGLGTSTFNIWHARMDKNGKIEIPPAEKFTGGPNRLYRNPVAIADTEGKIHLFWFVQANQSLTVLSAGLDTNGNIEVAPATLPFLSEYFGFGVKDVTLTAEGNIMLACSLIFFRGVPDDSKVIFPVINSAGKLVNPVFHRYFGALDSIARDSAGKFHAVNTRGGYVSYATLDAEKPMLTGVTLTDLLTRYRQFNF